MRITSYLLKTGAVLRSRRLWVNCGVRLPTCCKQASLTMPVVSSIVSTTITAAPISPLPCSYFKNYPWLTPGSRGIMVPHLPVPGSTTEDNRY